MQETVVKLSTSPAFSTTRKQLTPSSFMDKKPIKALHIKSEDLGCAHQSCDIWFMSRSREGQITNGRRLLLVK